MTRHHEVALRCFLRFLEARVSKIIELYKWFWGGCLLELPIPYCVPSESPIRVQDRKSGQGLTTQSLLRMIANNGPWHLVVSLIPAAALLWPTWHLAGSQQIHSYSGCPQASAAFIPCLKIIQTQSKNSFFEEGRHLWTWDQMQGLVRVLLSFSSLPLVQLVEKRSHGLECFLSLDKQKGGGIQCVFFSHRAY